MYSTYFQEWLSETFKPCILVYSTDLAKKAIKKNNLSPADFLRPLGDFTGKKIEMKFPESEIITFINFQIDFYDNNKYRSIPKTEIQKYIDSMFNENIPKWNLSNALLNKNKKNIEELLPKMKYYSSPYFIEYEKTLFECLNFDEHELYQQPLINILMCSSLDEPSTIINLLNTKENIPELILKQIYDPAQENLLIILNDLSDNNFNKLSEEQKKQNISKFKTKFSNYSIVQLDINIQYKMTPENKDISELYKKYFHKLDVYDPNNDFYRKDENIYGAFISKECIKKYKENFFKYFNFFLKNNLIIQIKRYLEIIENNSGIKSFLTNFSSFSLLARKEEINYYPNTKIYKLSELERAYYNLGLINFYFHNYANAYEYFKTLKGMINNKSVKFKERIKELMTMCKFIITYTSNEFDFVDEMIAEGTFEQIIRNELIIIKMYENNEDLYKMSENILNFIIATKEKFIREDKKEIKEKKDNKDNKDNKENENIIKNNSICFKYLYPLLYEKISIYFVTHNYYRKFQMFMAFTGDSYSSLPNKMKIYSLNSLSNLLNILDDIDSSFLNLKIFYNNKLSKICKNLNYWESYFKFSKNCFELLVIDNEKKNNEVELKFCEKYLDSVNSIQENDINCTNIDLNYLEIPQIDNNSLFILEENDYKIKKSTEFLKEIYKKENRKNPLTWMEFNKYSEKLVENYYVYLIEQDLILIKMLYDLANRKLGEMINIKNRNFQGNINQKLYVNINIKNPLTINIELSSIKLDCDFFPDKKFIDSEKEKDSSNEQYLKFSEENLTLKSLEDINILLSVESKVPGQMIVKGIEFTIFNKCKITHLFSKKNRKRLYAYKPKYSIIFIEDDENYKNLKAKGEKHTESRIIKTRRRMSSMYKKKRIEYYINDLSEDLYISFPKGNEISVYLYQFILFPISITNNSRNVKIKRFSIFLENSDDNKIKTFYKYITKKIYINRKHNNEIILIPFIPLSLGDIFIKIIIKFEDEIRVKPIEIKRAIIKINVKESISFELKEMCTNFSISKNKNIFDSYDILNFNIKADLRIINKEEIHNLTLEKPIFNPKKFNMLDIKEYLINKEEIHYKYTFQKLFSEIENNEKKDIQFKFDFIKEDLEKSGANKNSNSHIIEKLNKNLNNINNNIIFFPWNAFEEKDNQTYKINGLYPYNISLKGPEPTKATIRELFFNSTNIEIIKQKILSNKTLVVMLLKLNKKELITFNNVIEKYDIFVIKNNPEISWVGTQKYTIKNILDDNEDNNIFKCRFSFITSLKGMIEVNKISVLLYKKMEGIKQTFENMIIEHISKPLSVFLD